MSATRSTRHGYDRDPVPRGEHSIIPLGIEDDKSDIDLESVSVPSHDNRHDNRAGLELQSSSTLEVPVTDDTEFRLRKIRTEIADISVPERPQQIVEYEAMEAEGQRLFEMQERKDKLDRELYARRSEWYMQLHAAAIEISPKKELPPHRFGPVRWRAVHDYVSQHFEVRNRINYKTENSNGERTVSSVKSLDMTAAGLFSLRFECADEEVRRITLDLPPNHEWTSLLLIPIRHDSQKRYDMARAFGGTLGRIVNSTTQGGIDRLRFDLGNRNSETPAAIIAEGRGNFLPGKKASGAYDPGSDSFSIPRRNHRDDTTFSSTEFIEAIDQLFGLIPSEEVE